MLYFLPDSRDAVDPTYDFDRESRSPDRLTRDDQYCHEVLGRPYDGLLVSYATVVKGGIYSAQARRRLFRSGVREFFRAPPWATFMGDCGAFSYSKEESPRYTVKDVADFYAGAGFDYGIAVDHIVSGYLKNGGVPEPEWLRRYDLTLGLAREFWDEAKTHAFEPVGAVQGWSPASFAEAAKKLQAIGYRYLALGGVVRLRTEQLLKVLDAVDSVRLPETRLHLLGVTRPGNFAAYVSKGVASIDSTSPLRRAWMDSKCNYWLGKERYMALRIPPSLSGRIRGKIGSGEVDGELARQREAQAMEAVTAYARGYGSLDGALNALLSYQALHSPTDEREDGYRRTLEVKPWELCRCTICRHIGHHVILLRGAERNRRRGFHNVGQFYKCVRRELGEPDLVLVGCGAAKRPEPSAAAALYTGSLFRAHWKIARNYRAPIKILSYKYGLVDPAKVIAPYDASATNASKAERVAWGRKVIQQIRQDYGPDCRVVVLAGSRYTEWASQPDAPHVEEPLKGLTMGERMHAAKHWS